MARDDYRAVLFEHFHARKQRNPAYSMRSFARDLDWSPARLSQVLSGKAGLSASKAATIAKKLHLPPGEQELFQAMVAMRHGRSEQLKQAAAKRVQQIREDHGFSVVAMESFKIVRDWYHLAIVELLKVRGFQSSVGWIGQKLGLSPTVAAEAVKRLKQVGLLEEHLGNLRSPQNRNTAGSNVPSEAVKTFHTQILNKAIDSIYGQPKEGRHLSASIVAIDKEDLSEIAARIQEFRRQLCRDYGADKVGSKGSLYCLSVQCFSLERSDNA